MCNIVFSFRSSACRAWFFPVLSHDSAVFLFLCPKSSAAPNSEISVQRFKRSERRCLWRRPPSPAPDSGSVTEAHGISLPGADSRGFLDGSSSPTSSISPARKAARGYVFRRKAVEPDNSGCPSCEGLLQGGNGDLSLCG